MKTNYESFEDIVFENRNKAYGAYELRKRYPKRGIIAFIIAVSVLFLFVCVPLIANMLDINPVNRRVDLSDTLIFRPIPKPEPQVVIPPKQNTPNINDFMRHQIKVVEELTNEEADLPTSDELAQGTNQVMDDTTSGSSNVIIVDDPTPIVKVDIFEPYAIQEKPMYPGGDAALIKYIGEHTNYPVQAQESDIQGTVYIRFVVTKTGDVGETQVMRSVDPLLDDEALRVVKGLQKWTPGKNNGAPVNVWFIIPVKFQLR